MYNFFSLKKWVINPCLLYTKIFFLLDIFLGMFYFKGERTTFRGGVLGFIFLHLIRNGKFRRQDSRFQACCDANFVSPTLKPNLEQSSEFKNKTDY